MANDQYNAGPHPSREELLPGDLVFFSDDLNNSRAIHHVGLYVGGGYMINAPYTGAVIRFDKIDTPTTSVRQGSRRTGPRRSPPRFRRADAQSAVAGTLREAWALSCDDESLFDNVMVIIRWRAERTHPAGRSLDWDSMRT